MNPFASLRSLGDKFFRRSRTDQDLEDELRAHIHERAAHLERGGMNRLEAERQARVEFGSTERFKIECREALGGNFIDTLIQDVRFAGRMLRKSPGFTIVAVLTMALGIGATTAIFTVVNATLLHPLPYPHPEQLVRMVDDLPGVGAGDVGMSEPEWQDFQQSGIFEYSSPAWYDDNNLTGASRPARVSLLIVAPDYFALLGVKPQLGRTFPPADHSPGFTLEVVISDGLWKRTFGSDPDVIGRDIRMDTDLYRIVGVMPAGFRDPGTTGRDRNIDVWAATSFYGTPLLDHPLRSGRNLPTAIARLKPGLTITTAQSRLDALVASLQRQFPAEYPSQAEWKVRLVPLKESIVGNIRSPLILLFGAVALVLIIGCVNMANLSLARASARGQELALRQALGAERWRLTRQLLTESTLLSLAGGLTGLAVLFLTRDFLTQFIPESLPRLNEISISWGILLFTLSAAIGSGAIFGLAPALHAGRLDLTHMLNQQGRSASGSGEQNRTRHTLIVTEFALSLILMIAAGLLLHSFWDLLNVPLGFNPQSVIAIKTRIPYPNDPKADPYATAAQEAPFFREVTRRCLSLPGVNEAAFGDLGALPLAHDRTNQNPPIPIIFEEHAGSDDQPSLVDESVVSPEYFHLMDIPLRGGRSFTDFDNDKSESVAVINEAMAQVFWPNGNPLGKHVKLTRRTRAASWTTIVGVVSNARTESLENSSVPQIYTSVYQRGAKHLAIFLRGKLDAATIPEAVRAQVQAVDPTLPVFGAQTLTETVSASLSQRRFSMEMVAAFALTALLMAGLGIYGVISYVVSERTREIGIRLALGAQNGTILKMVLRQGLRLALIGTAVGLAVALMVARLMASFLFGVHPHDPAVFLIVPLLLFAVALLASYLPARRATRVNPITALRSI